MKKPNIIYIHSHDTGRYVQPYGHAVSTPNIQRLAEQGVLFRQAHNAAPTCSPSRAALLTGMCPHSAGQMGLVNRGFELPDTSKHVVHTLRRGGYESTLIGVQHIRRDPNTIGYDRVVTDLPSRSARDHGMAAVDFLANAPKQPFFLTVGFFETHRVFPTPATTEDPRYCLPPAPLPDTPETRRDMAAYKASALELDRAVGKILQALADTGLAEDTLVICTTDHGIAFPMMKCNLTDHGTGVMLIVRGPSGFSGGRVIDSLVSHLDIYPTLCELGGVAEPEWLQGRSLMPLIRGETEEINEEIFGEVNYHCPYEPQRAVRTQRWKYIRRYLDRETPLTANCDPGPAKEAMMQLGWRKQPVASEQLYDLGFDPNETANLIDDPRMGDVVAEMRSRLDRWMKRTDDPLLKGPIPAPEGAIVSRPDDREPQDVWEYEEKPAGFA